MHQKAMDQFRQTGIVVFLDVDSKDILSRLTAMKVDRIVGQGPGVSMGDILRYRQQFYETSYDLRILTPRNASPEAQADLVQSALESMDRPRDFMSTRQTCVEPIVHGTVYTYSMHKNCFVLSISLPQACTMLSSKAWHLMVVSLYQNICLGYRCLSGKD